MIQILETFDTERHFGLQFGGPFQLTCHGWHVPVNQRFAFLGNPKKMVKIVKNGQNSRNDQNGQKDQKGQQGKNRLNGQSGQYDRKWTK